MAGSCVNPAKITFPLISTPFRTYPTRQSVIVPSRQRYFQVTSIQKKVATELQQKGFDVRPILSPTVPKGSERLRICLHTFNTAHEIETLADALKSLHALAH